MVPVLSMVFMVLTLLVCLLVPLGAMIWLRRRRNPDGSRRHPKIWRAFAVGALAFFVSQVVLRLPLVTFAVPALPGPARDLLLSPGALSFSAGIFEETARLVFMFLLLKGFHRLVDGVAFGLGHGGIEALLLVGVTQVGNLALAGLINSGGWPAVAETMPAGAAALVHDQLVATASWMFLLSGVERVLAIVLHVGCSLLVLWGIAHRRRLLGWLAAVALHGASNWVVLATARWSAVGAEVVFAVICVVVVVVAVRARGAFAPALQTPAVPVQAGPAR